MGNNALHIATSMDRGDIVKLLLDTPGIDVYYRNKKGQNALTIAKEKGLAEIDQILSNNIDDSSQKIA